MYICPYPTNNPPRRYPPAAPLRVSNYYPPPPPPWPLHDIAITNIVWCVEYKRAVGEGAYIAQWSCNSIAIVWAMQGGG